jgi:hypothetical protein
VTWSLLLLCAKQEGGFGPDYKPFINSLVVGNNNKICNNSFTTNTQNVIHQNEILYFILFYLAKRDTFGLVQKSDFLGVGKNGLLLASAGLLLYGC